MVGIHTLQDRGACAPAHFDQFDSLIAPLGADYFFEHHWERQPFFIKRNIPGYFDALLSLKDMDTYLGTRTFHEADIRIVKQGKDKPFKEYSKDGVADRHQMLNAYKDGSMLLFSHLNRHHLPLAQAIARCEAQLHLPFRSNVYLSPPNSQGFKLHWDTHDVLVLQISGSKTWHIYNNPLELPHEEQKKELQDCIEKAEKIAEVTLEAGDVLFLPRGYIHGANASTDSSLHITVGMRNLTLGDVALMAFRRASLEHLGMRKVALHQQYQSEEKQAQARALIHELIDSMDLEGALDAVHSSFIGSRQPPAAGCLLGLTQQPALTHATRMRVRPAALYKMFDKTDRIDLALDGRVLPFPKGVEAAILFMDANPGFSPEQLPGLEYDSRLILARKLQAEGLLECVE